MPLAPHRWQALAPPAANSGLAVLVNSYIRTTELADRSLSVHVGTHGNSLGTADATFNNPAVKPVADDRLTVFVDTREIFDGRIKDVTLSELRGSYAIVKVGAQDNGPPSGLPTTPPWHLSDTPNGTTTHGYDNAQKVTRTTEGGSPKTTITTGVREHGLWAGMQVQFTSVTLDYSAVSFNIVDAAVRFPTRNAPEYDFELGQPLVSLAQLVSSGSMIDPGSITATQISDGAIITPKLSANAVIAGVASIGTPPSQVIITGGSIKVTNPSGTVIIDGSSDMFRIAATGTQTVTGADGANTVTTLSLTGLGVYAATPAHITLLGSGIAAGDWRRGNPMNTFAWSARRWVSTVAGAATNSEAYITTLYLEGKTGLDGSSFPKVELFMANFGTGAAQTMYSRYYILAQTAI